MGAAAGSDSFLIAAASEPAESRAYRGQVRRISAAATRYATCPIGDCSAEIARAGMSSLTQQLSALRARNAGARDPRKVKSLLLSSQEAATIDSASLHDAATAALAELSAGPSGDARLGAFAGSLFGPSSVSFERELHTREENARVDRSVVALLRLLSPHFLRAPAHRVLEFLIRRYRICECNVDAVIECALPCHDSPLFARVVQLLELEGTSWRFLVADSHQSASPLPRSVLAKRCAGDGGLREFVFALARHAAEHCGAEPSAAWERHFAFAARPWRSRRHPRRSGQRRAGAPAAAPAGAGIPACVPGIGPRR